MSTQKQIDANRRNAQSSTGPVTPEGKAASSRNALKSGLDAESQFVPGESREDFAELQAQYEQDYAPATTQERRLVDTLLRNEWLLRRYHRIEAHLRRAYNRTWDRLERMQRERHKMPLDEALKRTQIWLNAEARRNNRPQDIPARDPRIDGQGKLIVYPKDHPLWRPKKSEEDDDNDTKIE